MFMSGRRGLLIMRKIRAWNVILFLLIIVPVCLARPAAAQSTATDTVAPPAVAPPAYEWATKEGYIEADAHIVQVNEGAVYVDRGGMHGIVPGDIMRLYEEIEVTDLDGKKIGTDQRLLGTLRVEHVYEEMCTVAVVESLKLPVRGMIVRYLTPAPAEPDPGVERTKCPAGMQLVKGGAFSYFPGSISRDVLPDKQDPITERTENYCVDINPNKKQMTWSEARDTCGAQGKRLCAREEQHKTCAQYSRPPACSREQFDAGQCPRGMAVLDYDQELEWSAAYVEIDALGTPISKTGSCLCAGSMPACAGCYYPECRGVTKQFRCCDDPE